MKRGSLCLIGAALLCLAAIGWLQKEQSTSQESSAAESDSKRISSQASTATHPPPAKLQEFTPPSVRARRQPSKAPGPAQRLGFEPGDSREKEADANPVPVAARREGGGQKPKEAQPGDLNQPGTPPPADIRESLLKNGGFEEGLEFWAAKQCEVIREPGQKENAILEISPDGDGSQLEQAFQGIGEKRDLTLSFRVKNPGATMETPAGIHLDILDAKGSLLYTSLPTVKISEEWTTFSGTLGLGELNRIPATIRLKKKGHEGRLWIDDVALK